MLTSCIIPITRAWEERAQVLREYEAMGAATALSRCARELEDHVERWLNEPLTISEAALESGFSRDRLRELVREGQMPEVGDAGVTRVRRRHLPMKPSGACSAAVEEIASTRRAS